ncbi:aconitate hydratase AcnA [Propylenella binzhouense]|uniref:Aconitate hydratase n=1 Tax=Propylenella binzhouense TaxID=2555902 RepID=A0A964T1N0_9HYPH|nr:aconitate hydratase AcnA [Propylenella binzhouense]MYZ46599.1 aconitate hydratase AcnA [Propylenella binzhouense]
MPHDPFNALRRFPIPGGSGRYYALAALEEAELGRVSRLPPTLKVMLESLLRNCDGKRVTEQHVRALAAWQPNARRDGEIPFVVGRILLQDMSGFPALNDFAMLRATASRLNSDPGRIEPLVPVDVVVDHSVEVDAYGSPDALRRNMENEFGRNVERFQFLKWSKQAFSNIRVIPPGNGICHQVNLEFLARCVWEKDGLYYPDTLVGTDSHTTMINGIGVVGWGVGGIEAEAGMLGQPIYILTPDVVGVHLKGTLQPGTTATDLVLSLTEALRKLNVVGKFVEYFGEGAASLSVTDRAVVSNMSPDYGATVGFFSVDEKTLDFLRSTGRPERHVAAVEAYCRAQGLFGIPRPGDCEYSHVFEFDLATVRPSVSGPRRPQDRIDLDRLGARFEELLASPVAGGGYGKAAADRTRRFEVPGRGFDIGHGDIAIAAITSCTNTSNPNLMLAAGLLARKAVERGLSVHRRIKTSLAPGSRAVTAYLHKSGLLADLEALGFHVVAYGCTTCGGASGPLDAAIEETIVGNDLVVASVLSGNRNFEARIHPSVKANFLMSPALVVAFAIAGTVDIDICRTPLGTDVSGRPVHLADLWPSEAEIAAVLRHADDPETYRREYGALAGSAELWGKVPESHGAVYEWEPNSTYIKEPPFLARFAEEPSGFGEIRGARALALFGDSLTTDHISSVAPIPLRSPAGEWLQRHGANPQTFGNYGVRRCNHEVMVRGTFANVRLKNLMAPGTEGGVTVHQPSGELTTIYDASARYQAESVPLVVFAGLDYGTGSARDWAAKGTQLLGVRLVVARSFERIHRSNLIGMGVLPAQFKDGASWQALGIDGSERFDLLGIGNGIVPMQDVELAIRRADGTGDRVPLLLRVDTAIEAEYLRHGGILPYVLREILAEAA